VRPSRFWKSIIFAAVFLELVFQVWSRPLETNLIPPDPTLQSEAQKLKSNLGQGRVLILPDAQNHAALYTPPPTHEKAALFKYFLPNSNLFAALPLANFYGSTWPSVGAMDAQLYFEYCFPYGTGTLLDLLGVDLLWVTEPRMPARFKNLSADDGWSLYKNPSSMGSSFLFFGDPQIGERKEIFAAFASGKASPTRNLYLNPIPVSLGPRYSNQTPAPKIEIDIPDHSPAGFLIRTENALPGWKAWIDGSPAPIYLADGIFQVVSFPAETRKVQFEYEPASFRFGLFLSLFAVMAAFAGWRRWEGL